MTAFRTDALKMNPKCPVRIFLCTLPESVVKGKNMNGSMSAPYVNMGNRNPFAGTPMTRFACPTPKASKECGDESVTMSLMLARDACAAAARAIHPPKLYPMMTDGRPSLSISIQRLRMRSIFSCCHHRYLSRSNIISHAGNAASNSLPHPAGQSAARRAESSGSRTPTMIMNRMA